MRRFAAVACLVVLAGCGSSSSSTSTPKTTTASAADFKAQFAAVDKQLKATGTQLAKLFQTAKGQTDAALATQLDAITTKLGTLNGRLATLTPPAKLQSDYTELKKQFAQVHADLASLAAAARAHDVSKAKTETERTVSDSAAIKTTANSVRKALGLPQSP